jgi:hypothetical protein
MNFSRSRRSGASRDNLARLPQTSSTDSRAARHPPTSPEALARLALADEPAALWRGSPSADEPAALSCGSRSADEGALRRQARCPLADGGLNGRIAGVNRGELVVVAN